MEIILTSKKKLGFVTGTVARSTEDATIGEQWDSCNNMVIAWLHANLSTSIKKSVLFFTTAADVWKHLETRFALSNGSRKYKLNKDLFSVKQNSSSVYDYFTTLNVIWEELDSMNLLPTIVSVTDEVKAFLTAVEKQKGESKLFQFLNGLDEAYGPMRSQLLMMNPLPSVETASSVIQQEESQRQLLSTPKHEFEVSAMFSKGNSGYDITELWCVRSVEEKVTIVTSTGM